MKWSGSAPNTGLNKRLTRLARNELSGGYFNTEGHLTNRGKEIELNGMFLIETVSSNQSEIINNIISLYCPGGIDLDPTYSKGVFYNNSPEPRLKYDLKAQATGVIEADCRHLPLADCSQQSIMFDPPFICGSRAEGKPGIIKERFYYFKNIPELIKFYEESMSEFYRLLKQKGILIFKCQDTIDGGKQYLIHVSIINYALSIGFYPLDLFVLLARNVLISPNMLNQQHARKAHSYFLVFRKLPTV